LLVETNGRRHTMSDDKRDILEVLKFELAFLEQGGYGRSVRTPKTPTRSFQDSVTCINFCEQTRPHPCNECFLTDFVPENAKSERVPCHHIPLNAEGETVDTLRLKVTDPDNDPLTMRIVSRDASEAREGIPEVIPVDAGDPPVAALAMRLGVDARPSVVVLRASLCARMP